MSYRYAAGYTAISSSAGDVIRNYSLRSEREATEKVANLLDLAARLWARSEIF